MGIAIFNRGVGMKIVPLAEGVLIADGNEQVVVEATDGAGILSGFISMTKMEPGDTMVVRAYAWINYHYALYAQNTYSDTQIETALRFTGIRYKDKLKITLQQTTGPYRSYDYEFVRES